MSSVSGSDLIESGSFVESVSGSGSDSGSGSGSIIAEPSIIEQNIDVSGLEDKLDSITMTLDDLSLFLQSDPELLNVSLSVVDPTDEIDGYHMTVGSETVYVPVNMIEYFTRLPSGQLFNLSSNTITCYALDRNGNHGNTYRFPSFGSLQRYTYSGGSYYWQAVTSSSDNLVTGQVGLHNTTSLFLCVIVFLLFIIIFVRRR